MLGAPVADDVDGDDLAEAGLEAEEIEKLREMYGVKPAGEDVAVIPCNVLALEVFLAQETRWRYTPDGEMDGLDMAQVEATLNLLQVKRKKRPELFWKLRTMERAAREEMRR